MNQVLTRWACPGRHGYIKQNGGSQVKALETEQKPHYVSRGKVAAWVRTRWSKGMDRNWWIQEIIYQQYQWNPTQGKAGHVETERKNPEWKDKCFYFYHILFHLGVWYSIWKIFNREEAKVIYFCQKKKRSLEKVICESQLCHHILNLLIWFTFRDSILFWITVFSIVSELSSTNKKRNRKDIWVARQGYFHLTFDRFQLMKSPSGANKGGLLWVMQSM